MSTSDLTLTWSSPEDNSYIEYYRISYTPYDCHTAQSGRIIIPSTDQSYTITGLYSGMSYTVTVTAGNVLGESNSINITQEIIPTSEFNAGKNLTLHRWVNLAWPIQAQLFYNQVNPLGRGLN